MANCTCGSNLPGQYEYDDDKIVYIFVCEQCRVAKLAKAVAEERLRIISGTKKWWRDPLLLHRFQRLLTLAGYIGESRAWRADCATSSSYYQRIPSGYQTFFARGK